ncbi:MAG TPA: RNA polymerase sigma factor [Actinomycetes bacterium]
MESARLIAGLVRVVRDVGLAEDLAQDALVAALQQWPESGVPANPGAWLMTVAKRRAVDHFRRAERLARSQSELGHGLGIEQESFMSDVDAALEERIEDDLLRLMFICCHPVLSTEARVTLTLRLLGGLTTREIARSFLTSEATVAQRIVRAKRTLGEARAPFEVPGPAERAERLTPVLDVLYLVFNEGYSATAGDDWMRPALCEEALRLGRVLAGLAPTEPEVHGLVALMELQASRAAARVGPSGEPILLLDQDRAHWDQLLLRRGLRALERADALGGEPGPYRLQARIAACHARARAPEETDWGRIAELYDDLSAVARSPVVELNRAVALAMAYGPQAGLDLVDQLAGVPAMQGYHLFPSVRGDLLDKLGRADEARRELERAASLTQNERERALLLERAAAVLARAQGAPPA